MSTVSTDLLFVQLSYLLYLGCVRTSSAVAHPQPLIAVLWKEEGAVWVTGADGIVKRFEAPI